jgi:hypothetical protein
MRPQITAYLYPDTKKWLISYSASCGLHRSEIVRLVLERERQIQWLKWALKTPDPRQGSSKMLREGRNRSAVRWQKPSTPNLGPLKNKKR